MAFQCDGADMKRMKGNQQGVTRNWLSATIGLITLVVLWQVLVPVLSLPTYILPTPWEILTQGDWGAIGKAGISSSIAIVLAFLVGNVAGLLLAIFAAASSVASGVVQPLSVTLRSIPIIAIAPLLTLFFGRGITVTVVVGALIVFFPTLVNVLLGLRSTDREVLELMRILDCSPIKVFWLARLPASMPNFVAALKIAAPSAVLGVMVAEWIVGGTGLGQLILRSSITIEYPTMWGAVVTSAVLAGLMFVLVAIIERVLVPWQRAR